MVNEEIGQTGLNHGGSPSYWKRYAFPHSQFLFILFFSEKNWRDQNKNRRPHIRAVVHAWGPKPTIGPTPSNLLAKEKTCVRPNPKRKKRNIFSKWNSNHACKDFVTMSIHLYYLYYNLYYKSWNNWKQFSSKVDHPYPSQIAPYRRSQDGG